MVFSQTVHHVVTGNLSNTSERRAARRDPVREERMNGMVTRMVLGISAVVAVALALAGTPLAAGQGGQGPGGPGGRYGGPGGRGRGGPGGPMGPDNPLMMLGRLDLTDAQRGQVKQILDSHRDEQKALGDREFAAHSALEASIAADGLNEAVIRGKAAEVAAVESDMAVMRARVYAEIFQMLTPEQQAQAKQNQAEMRQREADMHSKRDQRQQQKP